MKGCGFARPPADGTLDREIVDRFTDFLAQIDAGRTRPRSPANLYHLRLLAWRVGMVDQPGCW